MRTLPVALALSAALSLAACGGSEDAKPAEDAPKAAGPAKQAGPKRQFPKFEKSGIVEDSKKLASLKDQVKYATTREEKKKAQDDLDAFTKETEAKWTGKPVPDPEAVFLGMMQTDSWGKHADAVPSLRRYLAVAWDELPNYPHAVYTLIVALTKDGQLDAAEAELAKASAPTGALQTRPAQIQGAGTLLAQAFEKKGNLDAAAGHFEKAARVGTGDVESFLYAADCRQRLGKPAEAAALAKRGMEHFKGQRGEQRMKELLAACSLVGQDAPGFDAASHWKGDGGPVTREQLKGKVTLVMGWSTGMGTARSAFQRVNKVLEDYGDRGLQVVGISHLRQYDPGQGGRVETMTTDEELAIYDKWCNQYGVRYPLAVGPLGRSDLFEAWAAQAQPALIVVGKDGKVAYTRTGFNEDHFVALRQEIDKALAR